MSKVDYTFLRGLELEGRHPEDAGVWGVTAKRLDVGEGFPTPSQSLEWSVEHVEGTPLPPCAQVASFYAPSKKGGVLQADPNSVRM